MVVIVADAAHEGGVAGGEDGVALVLSVGAQQVEAHEIALPHLVGVGQQGVEEGQCRVWPGIHQAVGAVEDSAVLGRCAGEGQQRQHEDNNRLKATMILHRCLLHGIAHEIEWQQVADALDDEGAFGAIEQDFDRLTLHEIRKFPYIMFYCGKPYKLVEIVHRIRLRLGRKLRLRYL